MQNRKSSAYWDARESAEQAWMKEQLAKDERFNKELDRAYQVAIDNINKEIQANIDKIGGVQNLVTASQMAEYERLAKQAVDHANELMKAGHKVTKKDFSPEVNARLKVYNATMRVNQLELMKSKIAVHNLNLGMDIQAKIADKLYDDYIKEMERQAGILGLSAKNASLWTDREVMNLISAQSANGVFSQRIWANTDVLKAKLDGILATGIIRGSNPREMARYLRDQVSDTFKNAVYASERLARTESARVQHKAQLKSLKDNGYDFCKWHLEPGACKICIGIREDATKYGLGVYRTEDVPDIPVHPNCRCAISAYWVDEDKLALANETTKIKEPADKNIYTVNRELINSKLYHDKFEKLAYPKAVRESLYQEAMKILNERNNTPYESLVALDSRTGKLVVKNNTTHTPFKSGLAHNQTKKFYSYTKPMILMHNHPRNSRPSLTDLLTASFSNVDSAMIIGHNGIVYRYWTDKSKNVQSIFDQCYNKYAKEGYIKEIAYSKAIDDLFEKGVIHYEKR
ncbi:MULTISPECIES: hypothetical protein [Lactobacillus]|uniref:hypothetical protein n=1 Tax=Lactobacillus TaxID=1578 RepID=UPI001AAEAA59|nr:MULTISPECIES: hypothetical protein [Lactobacillus]MCZ9642009.1 hypothetical protein [Lactobacillus jensenii]MCZ9649898.1 hypothetical protein [Lactobacillus mulieris]MCZ9655607.1 hypothetical protein [Lactobacillus iners]MCZ9656535.1 hypothetical protein [Lactobacillus jensenii]MCZ9660353.1 hypothetical protein [Lactobacillus jensenii]